MFVLQVFKIDDMTSGLFQQFYYSSIIVLPVLGGPTKIFLGLEMSSSDCGKFDKVDVILNNYVFKFINLFLDSLFCRYIWVSVKLEMLGTFDSWFRLLLKYQKSGYTNCCSDALWESLNKLDSNPLRHCT